jgi:molybdate transport system substrate-binding protein
MPDTRTKIRPHQTHFTALFCALAMLLSCSQEAEQPLHLAVAANFLEPATDIAQLYEQETGNAVILSFGSTGQLYTQITQEAPFDVFLAADRETPRIAAANGFALEETRFTYAAGRLALFSTTLAVTDGEAVLRGGGFEKLAIANPATAPYGAAAAAVLKSLGLEDKLREKIVQGNNLSQAFQFIETGNAELGFVALSQVQGKDATTFWIVPEKLHSPIHQDAVLLKRAAENAQARAFLEFLRSPKALAVVEKYGYAAPGAQ